MKKKARPESARGTRRRLERGAEKLERERERLFGLSPGGNAQRPLPVESPSVVESRALSVACPRCDGAHELLEHAAVLIGSERLREARLRCRRCGSRRSLFFRLEERRLN
jgi:DNA-directed RNA polymerase subunit RPC12/RpoP